MMCKMGNLKSLLSHPNTECISREERERKSVTCNRDTLQSFSQLPSFTQVNGTCVSRKAEEKSKETVTAIKT